MIYVINVFKDPDEGKFRRIRISNPVFQVTRSFPLSSRRTTVFSVVDLRFLAFLQNRIGRFEEGVKFLELCGFERAEGGNFLFLPRERVDRSILKSAAAELNNALTNPYFGLFSA